jgi:hypothetical protein
VNGWIGIVYESPPSGLLPTPVTLRELLENPHEFDYPQQASSPFWANISILPRNSRSSCTTFIRVWMASQGTSSRQHRPPRISIENPYIVGWKYSRKEAKVEHTESMLWGTSEANLYAHPGQLRGKPYCRKFDHSQLACLLIEIGYWKPLAAVRARSQLTFLQANSPHAWAEFLTRQADDFKFFMGEIYHDVTKRLLEGLNNEYAEFGPHVVRS